ncbi:multidrug efflux MFS transporter periplasmic adaptor subunit EmrA [Serratia symbiotica]|uniref:Multidrug efflux MFS transporter periplasmic adaptor subunit EmrA n=1 Tax=Serratia symbiotica TaxID=138074 RepID=A0A068ZCV4_9GAMM|nr:multidrug efflux MFS transporter periplasmic adaptor subunit EmrA [Serratia symbiotica]MBF1996313.1 multidrug efflux MFS transporter periplasmic adaptor subunit EmrA [Serratia symbiotica]MBQ0957199.1 multidrug efflux MFS transporter periplasmic adaptor subunit EmrA [Serratia symbiotica]QLH63453.1 multidrug efflux MFS transporter periplasmic adaptor subunit EmrA [Serratia symbiotica]QTP13845.1 multidrug efflux MFS transporter periplasmic adaptor subunit EmrA [Serratia symbiotica]CDS58758.1 m
MSVSAETQNPQQANGKKKQRKFWLLLLTVIFIIVGIAYFMYWLLVFRHYQETDDAYVSGNQVQIMAQVSGSVNSVNVDNTDYVKQGDVLLTLDPTDAEQAFERAKTGLANSVRQTHQLIINSKQFQANIALRKSDLSKAENDLKRRVVLGNVDAIGREELQHARDAVDSAKAALEVATEQYNANQAMVLDTPLEQQPAILQSAAQMRDAWLAMQRTKVLSPITGYVSRRSVQIGAQIAAGAPLMAVVPADHIWVDANFKETQIANMRIGQPVTVISDVYGDDVIYNGKVAGIDMGTGSAFSLLPAQNATGNWIKVVQRLPVRIELDAKQIADHPLRIGLSTRVKVDTGDLDGHVLSTVVRDKPRYQSNALALDLVPVNQMIAKVIHANAG